MAASVAMPLPTLEYLLVSSCAQPTASQQLLPVFSFVANLTLWSADSTTASPQAVWSTQFSFPPLPQQQALSSALVDSFWDQGSQLVMAKDLGRVWFATDFHDFSAQNATSTIAAAAAWSRTESLYYNGTALCGADGLPAFVNAMPDVLRVGVVLSRKQVNTTQQATPDTAHSEQSFNAAFKTPQRQLPAILQPSTSPFSLAAVTRVDSAHDITLQPSTQTNHMSITTIAVIALAAAVACIVVAVTCMSLSCCRRRSRHKKLEMQQTRQKPAIDTRNISSPKLLHEGPASPGLPRLGEQHHQRPFKLQPRDDATSLSFPSKAPSPVLDDEHVAQQQQQQPSFPARTYRSIGAHHQRIPAPSPPPSTPPPSRSSSVKRQQEPSQLSRMASSSSVRPSAAAEPLANEAQTRDAAPSHMQPSRASPPPRSHSAAAEPKRRMPAARIGSSSPPPRRQPPPQQQPPIDESFPESPTSPISPTVSRSFAPPPRPRSSLIYPVNSTLEEDSQSMLSAQSGRIMSSNSGGSNRQSLLHLSVSSADLLGNGHLAPLIRVVPPSTGTPSIDYPPYTRTRGTASDVDPGEHVPEYHDDFPADDSYEVGTRSFEGYPYAYSQMQEASRNTAAHRGSIPEITVTTPSDRGRSHDLVDMPTAHGDDERRGSMPPPQTVVQPPLRGIEHPHPYPKPYQNPSYYPLPTPASSTVTSFSTRFDEIMAQAMEMMTTASSRSSSSASSNGGQSMSYGSLYGFAKDDAQSLPSSNPSEVTLPSLTGAAQHLVDPYGSAGRGSNTSSRTSSGATTMDEIYASLDRLNQAPSISSAPSPPALMETTVADAPVNDAYHHQSNHRYHPPAPLQDVAIDKQQVAQQQAQMSPGYRSSVASYSAFTDVSSVVGLGITPAAAAAAAAAIAEPVQLSRKPHLKSVTSAPNLRHQQHPHPPPTPMSPHRPPPINIDATQTVTAQADVPILSPRPRRQTSIANMIEASRSADSANPPSKRVDSEDEWDPREQEGSGASSSPLPTPPHDHFARRYRDDGDDVEYSVVPSYHYGHVQPAAATQKQANRLSKVRFMYDQPRHYDMPQSSSDTDPDTDVERNIQFAQPRAIASPPLLTARIPVAVVATKQPVLRTRRVPSNQALKEQHNSHQPQQRAALAAQRQYF
ncbi:hypothetical protein RI367_004068 [Sorochytrium milnesiophthora]